MAKLKNQPKDTLDKLTTELILNPTEAIKLMLWKNRLANPDMYVRIEEKDWTAFNQSAAYQKVKPQVLIHREPGIPAQPGIPASGTRRAIPPREAIPPKPYLVIALVDEGTMNAIKPVENNDEDYDKSIDAAKMRKAKDQGPELAQMLINAARTGDFSSSALTDAAEALAILSRAT